MHWVTGGGVTGSGGAGSGGAGSGGGFGGEETSRPSCAPGEVGRVGSPGSAPRQGTSKTIHHTIATS